MTTTREDALTTTNQYYVMKPSGYTQVVDGYKIEPMICQPTPEGAKVLAAHYKEKYDIDIEIIDHALVVEQGDALLKRFRKFKETFDPKMVTEEKPIGFFLMHGQNHAVPIIFSRENNVDYMIVFDSNSGCRKKGYYPIAKDLFPNFQVGLNNGTRQADFGSCVADGMAILKDGLRMKQLGHFIQTSKKIEVVEDEKPQDGRPQFFCMPKPDNFFIFRMPEELLKSAQISEYVAKAEPNYKQIITKNNETLEDRRTADKTTVSLNKKPEKELEINRYVHFKSQKYAALLDKKLEKNQESSKSASPSLTSSSSN